MLRASGARLRAVRGVGGADYGGGMTYRSGWQDDDRGQGPREGDELAAPPGTDPMQPSPGIDPALQPPPLPGPQTPGAGMPEVVPGATGSWQQAGGAAYSSGGPGNLPARRERDQPMVSAFGDLVRTGAWDAARKTVSYQVFGDVKLDLRQVLQPGETLEVELYSLFGSAKILVPEGTDVQIQGMTLLGDARSEVGAAATGTPPSGGRLVVTGWSVFGDVRVRSVAAGEKLPRGWRWAQPKRS